MSELKSEQGGMEKERVRKNALLLFSKPPIPGLVKTRLTVLKDGVFQPEVASGLYHCMLFDVVEICCAAMADLERESAERAREALAAGEEAVRDEYEMIISTTPEKNVEVMRKLFSDAGEWPRELVFLCDEGASFDEHYNQAFRKMWERGADCILSMGADMPALTKADVRAGFYNQEGLTVLPAYIDKARKQGLPALYLPPIPDVDTMADLMHNITLVEALNYCAQYDDVTPPWRTAQALKEMGWDEVRVPPNDLHDPREEIDK